MTDPTTKMDGKVTEKLLNRKFRSKSNNESFFYLSLFLFFVPSQTYLNRDSLGVMGIDIKMTKHGDVEYNLTLLDYKENGKVTFKR